MSDAGSSTDEYTFIKNVYEGITNPTVFSKEWMPTISEETNELIGYRNIHSNKWITYYDAVELSNKSYKNRQS